MPKPRTARATTRPPARTATQPRPDTAVLAGAPLRRIWDIHVRLVREDPITAESLAAELHTSASTIKRDLALMRDQLGMPIEWDPIAHTYVYTRPCDTLPLVRLDAREALALALAGRLFDGRHGSPVGRMFAALVRRIAPVFGGAVTVAVESVDTALSIPRPGWHEEIEHLLALLEATLARRILRLTYAKAQSAGAETRVVHPLHLAELDGRWVLIAHDPARRGVRTFLLTRIRAVETTYHTFEPPEDFDLAAHLGGSLGRFAGDRETEVRVALDAHAAFYARETPWHPTQRLTELPDGRTRLSIRVNHLAGVRSTVLRWGDHAEVLAPSALRDELREIHRAALARYGER